MAITTKIIFLSLQVFIVFAVSVNKYSKHSVCNLRDRINNGCYDATSGDSRMECASFCSASPPCSSFVFSRLNKTCYLLSSCSYTAACIVLDPDLEFYATDNDTIALQMQFETTQSPIETTQSPIETTQSPIETTQSPIETTQSPIETTQSPIETTQSPIENYPESYRDYREPHRDYPESYRDYPESY
ncbi:LOW QUALITY PROTEIN: hypothetical protein ElyMa_003115900 [Elysia marginata]|uniref:Apple domain-containing protein n=1 Tax=Elysia marginata TaxID=1093978 RepID=A0AAV4IQC2_9GAST|nr:LOW QUALITY PROTEIN: hypothetical protein ElyMa_003115900 [Elysia marginata]